STWGFIRWHRQLWTMICSCEMSPPPSPDWGNSGGITRPGWTGTRSALDVHGAHHAVAGGQHPAVARVGVLAADAHLGVPDEEDEPVDRGLVGALAVAHDVPAGEGGRDVEVGQALGRLSVLGPQGTHRTVPLGGRVEVQRDLL